MRTLTPIPALVFVVSLSICLKSSAAQVAPAVQQIRNFYAVLIDTMKQGKSLGMEGRYKKLQPSVEKLYNFKLQMAFAAGPAWSTFSDAQKTALIAAFKRMTIATYAKNFNSYDGEKLIVEPKPIIHGTDEIVQTKIVDSSGKAVSIDYRMRKSNGTWKVLDVYLNGAISQLALHRSDYAATIAKSGAAGLIKKLDDLTNKLMGGKPPNA